jgi:hypothetical protein
MFDESLLLPNPTKYFDCCSDNAVLGVLFTFEISKYIQINHCFVIAHY